MMSSLRFHQSLLSRSGFCHLNILTKFSRNGVFTYEAEFDVLYLHLTTFKVRFLHLRLEKFLQSRVIFPRLCLIFRKWKFFTLVVVTRSKIPLPTKGKIFSLSATSYWPAINSCAVLKNEGRQFEVCAKWIAIQQFFGQNKSCSRGLQVCWVKIWPLFWAISDP